MNCFIGKSSPTDALQIIAMFQDQASKLSESIERINGAKHALGLESAQDNKVNVFVEEISGLREAWQVNYL